MNIIKIMMFIRGWLPQEPKLPKNLLTNTQKPDMINVTKTLLWNGISDCCFY